MKTSLCNPAAWRPAGAALLLSASAAVVFAVPGLGSLLQYDRALVGCGQLWRLLTGHWTHWSLNHLFWDLTAFGILFAWALRTRPAGAVGLVIGSSLAITGAVWHFRPELLTYRGLSGVDTALFVLVAFDLIRACCRRRDWRAAGFVALWVIGFLVKTSFESATGSAVFVGRLGPGVVPVPLAHLVGGACGALAGLCPERRSGPAACAQPAIGGPACRPG